MSFWSRERWRTYKRRLMSPLKRLEAKVRGYCQYFVLKTIEKHGIMPTAGAPASDGTTNSMMISMLQAKRRIESCRPQAPQATAVGDYLLTAHPRADFFYHAPQDLAQTPWILRGDFQPDITAWICSHVSSDERVLVVGGEQGYHALSIATQLGERGKVLVLSTRADQRKLVELNLRANRLDDKLDVQVIKPRELDYPSRMLRRLVAEFSPTMTIVNLPAETPASSFSPSRWHVVNTHAIEAGEVRMLPESPDETNAGFALRKAA